MKTELDWSSYRDSGMGDPYADIPKHGGEFAKAVSVCINSEQCKVNTKGVMCPSYRVNPQSRFSTGGRVRLLKAALNGGLGDSPFNDKLLVETMDLCLACKGCKRECENEVDMAMIKTEFLAQHYKLNPVPLRSRIFSNLSYYLNHYTAGRILVQLRNRIPLLPKITQLITGISAKRQLPVPVKSTFLTEHKETTVFSAENIEVDKEVVLLIDTFTDNFSPQYATDAISVLNKAGYKVYITKPHENTEQSSRPLCCGRTHIANGLVEQAKTEALRMLSVLLPHAEAGRSIIGIEPACLLAIRDDYLYLGLGKEADTVAKKAILFEEFIVREMKANKFNLNFKALNTNNVPLMVHGHCHQKAVGAMKSMRKILKKIPDLKFELIESTCCGMAGSFGIEKEHADIAMQMAEQSLLPALRKNPSARVLTNGFSCSHQIKEGVNRSSIHLATLLREAMT